MSLLQLPAARRRTRTAGRDRDRNRNRSKFLVETLEGRELMTASLIPLHGVTPLGPTMGFNIIDLAPMENNKVTGNLTSTGAPVTTNSVTVSLTRGEILDVSLEIDDNYRGIAPGSAWPINLALYGDSVVTVTNPDGTPAASGTAKASPTEVVFRAAQTGTYTVNFASDRSEPASNLTATGMSVNATLRPIELDPRSDSSLDPNHYAVDADTLGFTGGGLYAFLDQTGQYLNFSGPTGRGFQLKAAWKESTAADGTITYTAKDVVRVESGKVDVPMGIPPGSSVVVTTTANPNTAGLYGEVADTAFNVGGLNLNTFVSPLTPLGFSVAGFGNDLPQNQWKIGLGADATAATGAPTNPAVPYLYFAANAPIGFHYGSLSVALSSTGAGAGVNIVVDPEDPMIYVEIKGIPNVTDIGIAASVNDLIPFYPSESLSGLAAGNDAAMYGDAYIRGELDLAGATGGTTPYVLDGAATLNLDPNHVGFVNAARQFANDLSAIYTSKASKASFTTTLNDLKQVSVGIDGSASLSLSEGKFGFQMQLGHASALWSGQSDTLSLHAHAQLTGGGGSDTFSGTVSQVLSAPQMDLTGWANFDTGRFDVALTGDFQLFGQTLASASVSFDNDAVYIRGEVDVDLGQWSYKSFTVSGSLKLGVKMDIFTSGYVWYSIGAEAKGGTSIGSTSMGKYDLKYTDSAIVDLGAVVDEATNFWDSFKDEAKKKVESWLS